MSASVKKHSELLGIWRNSNPPSVKAFLKTASPELKQTLCEYSHIVLKGNVRLNQHKKKQLRRHKLNFRKRGHENLVEKEKKDARDGRFRW